MAVPWTQTLELRWRPALTFYEKRTAILRCLDDRKLLSAFRVGTDQIDARLSKRGHELTVRQDGLALQLLGQNPDAEVGWQCVVAALERITPVNTTTKARYQYVIPIDALFKDAVVAARRSLLSVPDATVVDDWALTLTLEGGSAIEFGIIQEHEAQPRLMRTVGRMTDAVAPHTGGFWHDVDFPSVAFFADTEIQGPQAGEDVDEIRAAWSAAEARSTALVESLYEKIHVEA